jgi:hypothetical protein
MTKEEKRNYIKKGVLKGRQRIPYEEYVYERALYWVDNVANKEQLEEMRNRIQFIIYEIDELAKHERSQTLTENTPSH